MVYESDTSQPHTVHDEIPTVPDALAEMQDTVNKLVYPLGYFSVQVTFAQRWAELSGEDFSQALYARTAIPRTILNDKVAADVDTYPLEWQHVQAALHEQPHDQPIAQTLYDIYAHRPDSAYRPPRLTFGAMTYDYKPDLPGIQFHFDNPVRGESPFSTDNMPVRKQEFSNMLSEVQSQHPDAKRLIVGTWLFSIPRFRALFPPNIDLHEPPTLSLNGDSLWGQFINREGGLNPKNYERFMSSLTQARTPQALIQSFPAKVLFSNDVIEKYYEFYNTATQP